MYLDLVLIGGVQPHEGGETLLHGNRALGFRRGMCLSYCRQRGFDIARLILRSGIRPEFVSRRGIGRASLRRQRAGGILPYYPGSDEEEDLVAIAVDGPALEQLADQRKPGNARRPVHGRAFLLDVYASHNRRAAILHSHYRLGGLSVDARS